MLEKENLLDRAEQLGAVLRDGLAGLTELDQVVDVRGLGLLAVVEMSSPEVAALVLARARDRGLLLRQQANAVLLVPPLVVDQNGLDAMQERTALAVSQVAAGQGPPSGPAAIRTQADLRFGADGQTV